MFGNLAAADTQSPDVTILPPQAGTDDLQQRRAEYLQWLRGRDTNTSSGVNSGTYDLEQRNSDYQNFLQQRSDQGTYPFQSSAVDAGVLPQTRGGPIKTGLRSALFNVLKGFSYGAGQAMLQPYGLADWQRAERGMQMQHMALVNQELAQGSELVDVTGPNGEPYQIPRSALGGYIGNTVRVAGQNQRAGLRANTQLDIANQRNSSYLAARGFTTDESGAIVLMDRSQLSPLQSSKLDLNDAHLDLMNAQQELAAARAAGEPQRIAIAARNAQTAEDNYALKLRQFNVATYGMDNGQPVPGGATDANGNPIGSASPGARSQLQTQRDQAAMDRQNVRDQAAFDRQAARQAATPPRRGYVRIQDSTGHYHDLPAGNLDAAKKRDPGLKVIQ